jgi:hypothetical protein
MDDIRVMEDWLGYAWESSQPRSMLAMDAFHGHLSERLRNRIRNKNTNIATIPSGMTSQLQQFDVSINKQFKHLLCRHYDASLNKNNNLLASSGKITKHQCQ